MTLKQAFREHGISFGMAVGAGNVNHELVREHCEILVPENAMKMAFFEPQENVWATGEMDTIMGAAHNQGMNVHGHCLYWGIVPDWLEPRLKVVNQSWRVGFLREYIQTVLGRYSGGAGILHSVDVLNECYNVELVWQKYGVMPEHALEYAAPYPVWRVYNMRTPNDPNYSWTEWRYAVQLWCSGQIDGVGIQFHLDAGNLMPVKYAWHYLNEARAEGIPVRFSECGVAGSDQQQVNACWWELANLAVKFGDVVAEFVQWGVKDPAWRGAVTLFNEDGNPKPQFDAVIDAIS